MKKKNLMPILGFISAACMIFGSTMINASANDSDKRYANLFSYDAETLSVQENYSLESKGLDAGHAGMLITSKKSGDEAEGAKIAYNGVMSGAFEMDFRVFSEKTYEENNPDKTYTHTAHNWSLLGNLGKITELYAADEFNPYMDLKEVGITFTSTLDTSKWFTVYVRGGYAQLGADWASARVFTSTDAADWPYALKGYGIVGGDGWPTASWMAGDASYGLGSGAMYTQVLSSFSNKFANDAYANKSVAISFDPATMTIYANGSKVRDMANNTGLHTFNDWFGNLDASYFTYGYTVDVTFTDVTSNTTVGNSLVDSETGYSNVADAGYKAFDAAYDRYANMVIYSFGGTTLNDSGPTVKVTDSAATIDGVTLDGTKFDNSNAVHLTTTKTGDEAEGTKFYVNETFNDTFEMDFRVFSQKNYTPKDASKTYTHTAIGWNSKNVGNSINYYKDDVFNPYLDLKEVGIKFTSATDSSKWFIVYVRGGYADLRADMASARVYTSTDNPDWPYALKGYGLVGGDGWPYASWDTNVAKGCSYTMIGSSFSNTYINGESPSTMIKFDPTSMTVFGYNGGWGAIRDLAGNSGLHTYNDGTWFGTLSAADFAGGYTVEIEFTDMTSNTTAGNSIVDSDVGYNNVADAAYQPFTDTYARYANMYVYGIKSGDVTLDNTDLISAKIIANKPVVSANYNKVVTDGQSIDVTPVVYDVNLGNIAYTGTVTWMNLSDETTGEIVANEGKYVFTPASNGTYLIFYSSMTAENVLATDSFVVAVVATDHNYGAWIDEVSATCVANGVKGHYTCSVCEKNFNAEHAQMTDLTITASAEYHNYGEWIAEVPATCVDNGTKAHYYCATCEQNFDAKYVVIADLTILANEKAHDFGEWQQEVPATCTETGIKGYYFCRYCEKYCDAESVVIENIVIPAAHTYGEWVAEVPATCMEAGVKGYQYCSVCEKNYDADGAEIVDLTLVALGHTDADENGVCDACETNLKSDEPTSGPSDEPAGDTSDTISGSAAGGCFGSVEQSALVIVLVVAMACLLMVRGRKENN